MAFDPGATLYARASEKPRYITPVLGFIALAHAIYFLSLSEWAYFSVWLVLLIIVVAPKCTSFSGRMPARKLRTITLVLAGLVIGVAYDVMTLGVMDAWVYMVMVVQALMAADASMPVLLGTVLSATTYIVVRTVEDVDNIGLYRVGELVRAGDSGLREGCSEGIGWTDGLPLLVARLSFLAFSTATAHQQMCAALAQQERHAASLAFAEDIIMAICALDLDTAENMLRNPPCQMIAEPFRMLHERMRIYSRYLPETLFDNGAAMLDESDEDATVMSMLFGDIDMPHMSDYRDSPLHASLQLSGGMDNTGASQSPSPQQQVLSYDGPLHNVTGNTTGTGGGAMHTIASSSPNPLQVPPTASMESDYHTDALKAENADTSQPRTSRVDTVLSLGVKPRRITLMAADLNVLAIKPISMFYSTCTMFVTSTMNAVRSARGMVLDIKADRVVASWNSHQRCVRHAHYACKAALEVRVICSGSSFLKLGWSVVLTSGESMVGNIGDDRRRAAFVHGTALTQLSTLPLLCKALHVQILATEKVQEQAMNWMLLRPIDVIPTIATQQYPQQQSPPMVVYELVCDNAAVSTLLKTKIDAYCTAFNALRAEEYVLAADQLRALRSQFPRDEQILRVLQMLSSPRLPVPLLRGFVGWEIFPKAEKVDLVLSCEESRRESYDSEQVSLAGPTGSSVGSDVRLREAVDILNSEDFPAEEELPLDIIDRAGSKWRRSAKSFGARRDEVWQVLGEDGSLCILKCASLLAAEKKANRLFLGQQGRVDDLFKEVRMLSTLHHENVVSYLSSAVIGGHMLTVVEFVSGGSLQQTLDNFGALPSSCVKRYTKDVLRGLEFLHMKGIVHRDLKPSNVLLEPDGACKLADFGAAAELTAVLRGENRGENGASGPGEVIGTPPYIAPEACHGVVEKLSDIWSLGITTIQLLTNELPFTIAPGPVAEFRFVHDLAKEDPPLEPTIPEALLPVEVEFVMRCLTRDYTKRPSADELRLHAFFTEANIGDDADKMSQ